MPGGRRRQPSAGGRFRAAGPALAPCPVPVPPPGEPAQMVQAEGRGRDSRRSRRAAVFSRRTPLSHLPDKHHENSAAHTVIAAPAAGRVSTSPSRGASESEISPPPLLPAPSSGRGARAAAPAPPTRPPAPTARRPVRPRLSPVSRSPAAPQRTGTWLRLPIPRQPAAPAVAVRGVRRSGPPSGDQARKSRRPPCGRRAGCGSRCCCCGVAAPGRGHGLAGR